MNDESKDEAKKPATGSGSDTVSAAKMGGNAPISAGTSAGDAGHPATPGTGASTATGAGSAQSSTRASHTSKPLGGGMGATTGAGAGLAAHSKDAQQNGRSDQGSHGSSQGSEAQAYADQAKAAASSAAETVSGSAQAVGETLRQTAEAVQERAGEAYEQASQWAREKYEQATEWTSDQAERGSRQSASARRQGMQGHRHIRGGVERFVAENPVLVGIIGLAAGLLLGALLPRTRQENRAFGAWSDEVRDQGLRYAHDMAQRGRDYVEEALSDDGPSFAHHESEAGGRDPSQER